MDNGLAEWVSKQPDTYEFTLRGGRMVWIGRTLLGIPLGAFAFLFIAIFLRSGSILWLTFGVLIACQMIAIFRIGLRNLFYEGPDFHATRSGFRILGGAVQSWDAFHGVWVINQINGRYQKTGELVLIRIKREGLFQYRTVGGWPGIGNGNLIAHEISSFCDEIKTLSKAG